jgi:hypothetical protein
MGRSRTKANPIAPVDAFEQRDRLPALALVGANLVPLLGVVLFDWDVRYLLLLYWLENLVIGAFTLVRMLHIGGARALAQGAFFTFHYGFFCAGHGMVVLAISSLSGIEGSQEPDFDEGDLPFLMPFYLLRGVFQTISVQMPELLHIPLLALILSHGFSLVRHHFIGNEDAERKVEDIMFDPYRRILMLHVSIIAGSFFVIGSGGGSAAPVLIILIAAKTWLDLRLHRRAHQKRYSRAAERAGAD